MNTEKHYLQYLPNVAPSGAWVVHTDKHAYFGITMYDALFEALPDTICQMVYALPKNTTLAEAEDCPFHYRVAIHVIRDIKTFREIILKIERY